MNIRADEFRLPDDKSATQSGDLGATGSTQATGFSGKVRR